MDMEIRYEDRWNELRRLNKNEWVVIISAIPGVALFAALASSVGIVGATPYIGGAWLVAYWISSQMTLGFKCPQCNDRFFVRGGFRNGFSSKCLNCGLPKWALENNLLAKPESGSDPTEGDDPVIGDQWKIPPN